jgi:uracil-DNA glycosylase family 4
VKKLEHRDALRTLVPDLRRERVTMACVESLERHRELVRGCSRCYPGGGNAPVVEEAKDVRVLLVGQAPGATEVETRLPFTGPAGGRLEGWLAEAGVSREEVYLSALARCFPGKAKGGGDRVPGRRMLENCRPHLLREFELLRPEIVVPVGGLATRELLGVGRLSEAVGETFGRDGVVYVPLPHPSGVSTWLNVPENRDRLSRALAVLGGLVAAGRIGESDARRRRLKS